MWKFIVYAALATVASFALAGCGNGNGSPAVATANDPAIQVTDTAGAAVVGAEVFAIPVADVAAIAAQPIILGATTDGNYDTAAQNVDEPLEDLINGNYTPTGGGVTTYVSATTDASGEAVLTGLPVGATDKYFIYVAPATTDTGHLPGGSLCRNAVTGESLSDKVTAVEVSTTPSASAAYIGSSACLGCHTDYASVKQTAHKHGIMEIGTPSGLQDLTRFNADDGIYNYMAGVDMFAAGDATSGGTTVWFSDFDNTRGFDKYKTQTTAPSTGTVYATVRAYKDSTTGKYMMQITNVLNSSDPNSPLTIEAVMTYGGGVYKQRYLTLNASGTSMHMLPLQYQANGDDTSADRTRKQYRDYHMDRWYDVSTNVLVLMPSASKSFDINCASCHYNGYKVAKNGSGEYTASAVYDPNGTLNPLTGITQEMNVGCETCHGPGSEHQAAGGNGVAIVCPTDLPVERASMLCGRCHSRPQGNDGFGNHTDQPLDSNNEMLHAGSSRADFLANFTNRDDAKASSLWNDGLHSKSHHQQYTDFITTDMYRNDSELTTCTDCHDVHAPGTDRHQLSGNSDNSLCISCHASKSNVVDHMVDKTGTSMNTSTITALCSDCHMTKTAKSGAGETVGLLGGTSGNTYYTNDITSHRLDVPRKADIATTAAMPIPYSNSCGLCHQPSGI